MSEINKICICGGGGLGHTCAAVLSSNSNLEVMMYTKHPEKWNHEFIVEYVAPIGTFIEFEDRNFYSHLRNGESIEELITLFDTFKIKYDKSDFESYLKVWQYENGEEALDLDDTFNISIYLRPTLKYMET